MTFKGSTVPDYLPQALLLNAVLLGDDANNRSVTRCIMKFL